MIVYAILDHCISREPKSDFRGSRKTTSRGGSGVIKCADEHSVHVQSSRGSTESMSSVGQRGMGKKRCEDKAWEAQPEYISSNGYTVADTTATS